MRGFWKWFFIVIGILLVLGLGALALVMFRFGYGHMPMMGLGFRSFPMMRGFGFFGFGMMAFRLIVPAVIIALLVLLGVSIGRSGKPAVASATTPVPAQPVDQVTPSAEPTCSACGRTLQKDWVNCPYCGQKVG